MYKIMIAEDEPLMLAELESLLRASGYETAAVRDFSRAAEEVAREAPHLLLLDITLPGMDGFALCREVRRVSELPVVFVTSRTSEMDELNSILLGGDAFITKPYRIPILLAKISSLLRKRYEQSAEERLSHKNAVLRPERGTLEYGGKTVELTKNELKILYCLFSRAGSICSREELIDYLWDNQAYVDDNALSVNITRLREKLAAAGLKDFIRTRHRQGYQL